MKQLTNIKGFTLIELLVVIAIIAILSGLLLPAVTKVKQAGYENQARTEMQGIVMAVKAFHNQYGKLPIKDTDQGKNDASYVGDDSKEIIKKLVGDNPGKRVFLETKSSDGTFLNPWNQQYGLIIDNNYNNKLELSSLLGTNTPIGQVVVYSDGLPKKRLFSIKELEK